MGAGIAGIGSGVPLIATLADPLLAGRLEAVAREPGGGRAAAARELETIFLSQVIAALRRTTSGDGQWLPAAPSRSVYGGLFDHELAAALAASDPLGLVRAIGGGEKGKTGRVAVRSAQAYTIGHAHGELKGPRSTGR